MNFIQRKHIHAFIGNHKEWHRFKVEISYKRFEFVLVFIGLIIDWRGKHKK